MIQTFLDLNMLTLNEYFFLQLEFIIRDCLYIVINNNLLLPPETESTLSLRKHSEIVIFIHGNADIFQPASAKRKPAFSLRSWQVL